MKPAGAANVAAAGRLILELFGMLNVRIETESQVVTSKDPGEIGVVVPFRIPVVLRLESADRAERSDAAVDRDGGQAALLQRFGSRQSGGIQSRNLHQCPAEILVLCGLLAVRNVYVVTVMCIENQARADDVRPGYGAIEDV